MSRIINHHKDWLTILVAHHHESHHHDLKTTAGQLQKLTEADPVIEGLALAIQRLTNRGTWEPCGVWWLEQLGSCARFDGGQELPGHMADW